MSPEILFLNPYTIKSEIWSLGILYFMILYHIHPFGNLQSLDDYRIKIKNEIIYLSIDNMNHIIELIKKMLKYKDNDRPDINTVSNILNNINEEIFEFELDDIVPLKNNKSTPILESKKIEYKENKSMSSLLEERKRIFELEEHIFKLESIIKEKDKEKELESSCCFNFYDNKLSDDEQSSMLNNLSKVQNINEHTSTLSKCDKINKNYENDFKNLKIDYFTPPSDLLYNHNIPKYSTSLPTLGLIKSVKDSPTLPPKTKGLLSKSIESMYNFLSKSFSK
jgi:serine/threonine protein kinase